MQLKIKGESLSALDKIGDVFNRNTNLDLKDKTDSDLFNGELVNGLKGYSTEATQAAIAQSKLSEEQIKAILHSKGLRGEVLKTTAAELAAKTETNSMAAAEMGAVGEKYIIFQNVI